MRLPPMMILAAGLVVSAAPVSAQTYDPSYPVCLKVYSPGNDGGGEYNECRYTSLAQCRATASGLGATCIVNPYFVGTAEERSSRGRRLHRRGH
jgi:hypothetical protein